MAFRFDLSGSTRHHKDASLQSGQSWEAGTDGRKTEKSWRTTSFSLEQKLVDESVWNSWLKRNQRNSDRLQCSALCNTFPFWNLAVMTGGRRAEPREHQNSIIWSFFHKLFHSCSNPLEQTSGGGRNTRTEPSEKRWVTAPLKTLDQTRGETHGRDGRGAERRDNENEPVFTLLSASITRIKLISGSATPQAWTRSCMQWAVSLLSATWLKTKYRSWRHCFIFTCSQD